MNAVVRLLAKAVRARRMYDRNNEIYRRFVDALSSSFRDTWDHLPTLELDVREDAFLWGDHEFRVGGGRDRLPFLFFKDGVRQLTFLPGFEDEVEAFLGIVNRGRAVGGDGEDLVALLWEADLDGLRYRYVDQFADAAIPAPGSLGGAGDLPSLLEADLPQGEVESPGAGAAAAANGILSPDDFKATLYFLDPAELELLEQEVEREWSRDLETELVNGLLDRLEDSPAEDQAEILEILRLILPGLMAAGELGRTVAVLDELQQLVDRPGLFRAEERELADSIFDEVSDPDLIDQLVGSLGERAARAGSELDLLLRHVRPGALEALVRAVETTSLPALRDMLRLSVDRLSRSHEAELFRLLELQEDIIAAGAARLVGRLRPEGAAPRLAELLRRTEPRVRLAAVEGLVALASGEAAALLQDLLQDEARQVRLAAVRGLATLRFAGARDLLAEALQSRHLAAADLTEKIAFFDAYAAIADHQGIALLDRILNGRSLLGRGPGADLRACAARALGRIGTPGAMSALRQAEKDPDAVVRSAVARGLRYENA